jgi:hypothetical protein
MEIIKKFEEELIKEELKPKTIKNYISDLNTVLDIFDYTINFLKTPQETIKILKAHYPNVKTLATKINIIIMLLKLNYKDDEELQKCNKEYLVFRNQLKNENEEYYKQKIANPKQIEQAMTHEDIEKIKSVLLSRIKYATKNRVNIINIRNYLFFAFITFLHSRTDFIKSKLVLDKPKNKYDKDTNYIVLNKRELSIKYLQNDYKTAKTYGSKSHDINNETFKLFIKLFNAYKKLGVLGGYAFYQNDLIKPMNSDNASKLFHEICMDILGKSVTIQSLRIAYASSPEDIEAIERINKKSNQMGHNLQTHTGVYMKTNMNK